MALGLTPGEGSDVGGGLGGGIASIALLLGAAGKGGKGQYEERVALAKKIQEPDFDFSKLTWPEIQVLRQDAPQLYQAIVPDEFKQVQDSPGMRDAQVQSLATMQRTAQQGIPLEERLAAQDAQGAIMGANRRSNQAVLSDMAQRGRLGSGDELQARMMANQGSQGLASSMGDDLARQAIANRLGASQMAGQMGGQIRGQDINLSGQNANISNQFNTLAANMRNMAAMQNAQERQRSQSANIAQNQQTNNMNQLGRFDTRQQNIDRSNRLKQQGFGNQMTKYGAVSNALAGLGDVNYEEQAAKAAQIRGVGQGIGGAAGGIIGFL